MYSVKCRYFYLCKWWLGGRSLRQAAITVTFLKGIGKIPNINRMENPSWILWESPLSLKYAWEFLPDRFEKFALSLFCCVGGLTFYNPEDFRQRFPQHWGKCFPMKFRKSLQSCTCKILWIVPMSCMNVINVIESCR